MAVAMAVILPIFLMHGRAVADGLICAIGLMFLSQSWLAHDWDWLRAFWVRIAIVFWGWLIVCSLPGVGVGGMGSFLQAVAFGRFLLLPAALGTWVLRSGRATRLLQIALAAATAYIIAQTVLQLATGFDLQGFPRSGDGELTGPFEHPRAGEPLSRLLFPVLLPLLMRTTQSTLPFRKLAAAAMAVGAISLMVLIGQRMPLLLTAAGFVLSGLLLRPLRPLVAATLVAGVTLVGASMVVSPPAFHRLVTKFSTQIEHFPDSSYGQIAGRALVITLQHPLMGVGFDGFRNSCSDPSTFHGLAWIGQREADGGGLAACNIHPHNHYLEAMTEAGLPGLILFAMLIGAWVIAAGRGLIGDPAPLRVGLLVAVVIQEWPIASMGGFTSIELSGFFFVLLGYALAEAPQSQASPLARRERPANPQAVPLRQA